MLRVHRVNRKHKVYGVYCVYRLYKVYRKLRVYRVYRLCWLYAVSIKSLGSLEYIENIEDYREYIGHIDSTKYTEYIEYPALCLVISYVNFNDTFNCGTLQKVCKFRLKSEGEIQREKERRAVERTGKADSVVVKEKDDESTFIFTLIKLKYVVVKCTT